MAEKNPAPLTSLSNTKDIDGPSSSNRINALTTPQHLESELSLHEDNARIPEDIDVEPPGVVGSKYSRFKQQNLPAWHPSYTMGSLYWKFLIGGLVYIPLGILLIITSKNLNEIEIPYTDCMSLTDPTTPCSYVLETHPGSKCTCEEEFTLAKDIDSKMYMYYALDNFYQNHRMYVKSRDNNQLLGDIGSENNIKEVDDDCAQHDYIKGEDGITRTVIPCGAIANSLFNDSIILFHVDDSGKRTEVKLKRTGIAWESDKKYKFKNPKFFDDKSHPIWGNFTQPKDWGRTMWDLDPDNPENNGLQNEDFIVWMRTAALANFRKPYRIIEDDILKKGKYVLKIDYLYNTKVSGATKSIVLCDHSPLIGSKNPVIGITFSVVGALSILIALAFLYFYISSVQRSNIIVPAEEESESEGEDAPDAHSNENVNEHILSILQRL